MNGECEKNMDFPKISAPRREDLGEKEDSYKLGSYVPTGSVHQGGYEGASMACASRASMADLIFQKRET